MAVKLVGIGGTNGSGKDTLGSIIAAEFDYLFISVSDILRVECRKRGLEVTRENLRNISAEWRREFGLGVLVDKAIEIAEHNGRKGVVACPMRNVGEAQHLKDLGGTLIWADADPKIRYERIQSGNRGRAGEDDKTYEEFLSEEQTEMHPPEGSDDAVLNGAAVKKLADTYIENNHADMESFEAAVVPQLKRSLEL